MELAADTATDDTVTDDVPPPPAPVNDVVTDVIELFDTVVVPVAFMYFKLSQCGLYSMGVFGGKFKIRRNVSRIRFIQW